MAESDDEYDRKRRDKFRGERSSGDSYRSDRRDDRRPVVGGGVGGREDWADRNPFRGGGRARPDYRDYRPPRDRYGSPGREMPPAKRMRPDWGDELRAGHRYSAYDPYLMHAWNEHYASTHGLHGGAYGHAPMIPHLREQNLNSDLLTQPAMLTLKQFLDTQDDGISDSEVLRKYSEYKLEFKRQQLNEFFVAHKDEEWFKNKYHPVDSVTRMEEQLGFLKKRVEVFNELLENESIKSVSVDTNQQDLLLRLLDTVVIKLEGGTDDDLKILDEKPRDIIYPDRVIEKKPEHDDDDVIITSVEKKKVHEDEGEPKIVSPRQIRRAAAASDDEENWDEDDDDDDDDTPKRKGDEEVDDEENDKFKDDDEKKIERKRKPSNSDSSSSSSSTDSDTTSSSSSDEDEDVDKSSDKYDLAKVKQEKEDEYEERKAIAEAEKTVVVKESLKVENETEIEKHGLNGLDKKDGEDIGDNTDENIIRNEIQITDKVDATDQAPQEETEIKKQGTAEVDDAVELNTSAVSEEKSTDENLTNEAKGENSENVPPISSKDNCDDVVETEPIDVDKEKDKPRPRALHRTSSIFLRNLAPSITKAEIEAVCQKFEGFLRVAIADPLIERRWYRRGWVTFKRDVNIKEYCWNLNNTRLRDCEMGAIVNRDLSRRVRPVNGMTAHKTVVRADVKLCAKIILNLDEKFKLWKNAGEKSKSTETDKKESDNASNNFGFHSNNPILQNITDYLIEEASAEEEELLGISGSDGKDTEGGESLERDPQLISVLDGLILYLRIVHSVDFYNHCEYPYEDEMPNRCGIIHARGPPPQKIVPNDIQEYIKTFEGKMQTFLAQTTEVDDEELKNLGGKDPDVEVEKFVQANTQELAKDKWLCPLSGKKFKGPEFIRKHIFNKHMDKVDEVRKEVDFFNNYLRDPKRPQLPEHPGATKRTTSETSGGYRPPPYAPMYSPYAAYAPPMLMPPRGGRGYGGRRPGGEYRQIIQYRDLDAPQDPVDMFT